MGKVFALKVSMNAGKFSGNEFKVLNYIAWNTPDRGMPPSENEFGEYCESGVFMATGSTHGSRVLGTFPSEETGIKMWERSIKGLLNSGVLSRIARAIPHCSPSIYRLHIEALDKDRP